METIGDENGIEKTGNKENAKKNKRAPAKAHPGGPQPQTAKRRKGEETQSLQS